jgi:hypothetical protein
MHGTRIALVAVLARSARLRRSGMLLTAGLTPAEAPYVRPIEVEGERE